MPASSCNNEERLCLGAKIIDYGFVNYYNCWYSICDPIIRHTPTLPPLSSITAPYNSNFCKTASSACVEMKDSRSLCEIAYTSGEPTTSVSKCFCSPPVLSLEYTCSFLGNISCLQVPAHFTRMTGWTICSNFDSVLTVAPSVVSTSQSIDNTLVMTRFSARTDRYRRLDNDNSIYVQHTEHVIKCCIKCCSTFGVCVIPATDSDIDKCCVVESTSSDRRVYDQSSYADMSVGCGNDDAGGHGVRLLAEILRGGRWRGQKWTWYRKV